MVIDLLLEQVIEKPTNQSTVNLQRLHCYFFSINFFPQVSLILFNSTTFLPADKDVDECYNTTMAFASTFTINYLKSFINRAQPRGRKATAYAVNSYFFKYLPVPTFELARAGKEWQTYC